ncbi:conserved repeat domain protein (DUF58) [Halorhabdus tiamatea SARL4B]|uniref:Conserved repeat domain protein (DUF58) n=1 Tax=Halorhabdus tiamatea SARL4B TaxID=1033806 RepID=S6CU86_9EURY|nr:conserved repeat domain protein (DUF58) [Halorhabdus tiamatea SARL4B]
MLAVLGGIAIIVRPSLASDVALEYGIVPVLGVAVLAVALRYWIGLALTSIESATLPTVEGRASISVPGGAFDRTIADRRVSSITRLRAREAVLDRLRSVAEQLSGRDRTGPEGTSAGSDDAVDALFEDGAGLRERLRDARTGETAFQRQVRAAVAALADRHDGERPSIELDVTADEPVPTPTQPGLRATNRWRLLKPMGLTAVGIGAVFGSATLLLVGALVGGVAVVAAAGSAPSTSIRITRQVESTQPTPGEAVRVTIEVENVGNRFVPDLRVVDRVPEGLSVTAGSPRYGTALRPGATATYDYRVTSVRGRHEFGDAALSVRNFSGTLERVEDVSVAGDAAVTYDVRRAMERAVPVRDQTSRSVGRVVTDVGGSGVEFHSVRQYRTGDPLNRIDWSRAARGEGLATLQFREERSATVVVLVDARREAYVAPETDAPSAVDRSVLAAAEITSALLDSDDQVGLAALSPRQCWVSPGSGHAHLTRLQAALANADAFDPRPPEQAFKPAIRLPSIRKRLPGVAQLIVLSPVCDDELLTVVRQLQASGHSATVVSPDATGGVTPGRTLARIERDRRLSKLREAGVRVVDWDPADPLALALSAAARRWS